MSNRLRIFLFTVSWVLLGVPEYYLARRGIVSTWWLAFFDTFYGVAGCWWIVWKDATEPVKRA